MIEKYSVNPPNVYGFGHQAYYEHVVDCLIIRLPSLLMDCRGEKVLS